MTVTAGSFVGYDADNIKSVGVVIETSTNMKNDGTSESFALVAMLPTVHVPLDSLFPYGTDPTVKPTVVTESTSDIAAGMSTTPFIDSTVKPSVVTESTSDITADMSTTPPPPPPPASI